MAKAKKRYTPEFRRQMVELHRAGRRFDELGGEFGVTPWSIRQWVKRDERDGGTGDGRADEYGPRGADEAATREPAAQGGAGNSLKSSGLVCERNARDIEALFGFVKANQATNSVRKMCRLLRISKSGFYAWDGRPMSAHERTDIALTSKIQAIYLRSRETYGSPDIHAELADDHKIHVGRKRVARLMRVAGLRGATLRKFVITTVSDGGTQPADLVNRRFYAERPNRLWVADATYVPTWSGFLYLAIVLDVFSRKVVGWAMGNYLRTELMLSAINMAITMRRPRSVIHHSDHGCQYTSYAFGRRCVEANIVPSMGTVGDAYDNAMAESFFATLEREVLDRQRFKTQDEAQREIFSWLEGWYNPSRRHSGLGYVSPREFERRSSQKHARRRPGALLPHPRETALR